MKYPKDFINQVKADTNVYELINQTIGVKTKGRSHSASCPNCGKENGLKITKSKNIAKCFSCDYSVSTATAIDFIKDQKNIDFVEAVETLANFNGNIFPEEPKPQAPTTNGSFLKAQLKASGIENYPKHIKKTKDGFEEFTPFTSGSLVDGALTKGNDIIIHFLDLDGEPATYQRKTKNGTPIDKKLPFYRIRYQFPEHHLDKNGKPKKYASPYQSGSKIYWPQKIRDAYKSGEKIETLYIDEGEKKAECASLHGQFSCGITGIQNIASNGQLSHEFNQLIEHCQVKNVILRLDADCFDISENPEANIKQRPFAFWAAVKNFQAYFKAFAATGVYLELYFCHVRQDQKLKGIDDLLTAKIALHKEILQDAEEARLAKNGQGQFFNYYKITEHTETKLKEIWSLQSNDAFITFHSIKLKERPFFFIGKVKWHFVDGQPEPVDKLDESETFWDESVFEKNGLEKITLTFNYYKAYKFLHNRKFGRFSTPGNKFRFVKIDGKIVKEVDQYEVKDYITDYLENSNNIGPLNMIYRGGTRYFGPESLSNLKYLLPNFHHSDFEVQYLYFKNCYWKITAKGIEEQPLHQLDGHVWSQKVINFEPKKEPAKLLGVQKITATTFEHENLKVLKETFEGHLGKLYDYDTNPTSELCDFADFLQKSSLYVKPNLSEYEQQLQNSINNTHFLSKVSAIGYLLHTFKDASKEKAVVAMDGAESEVGESEGRTGKSLMGQALNKVLNTAYINGKNFENDRYPWEEVDERTDLIFIDDVNPNYNFELLFPQITGKFQVEKKGIPKFTIPKEESPKIFITTNHALKGDGSSFKDRQHLIGFSDYFNDARKPIDVYGKRFFDEWDFEQWNAFYNFMAECIHIYLKFGFIKAPEENLERRKQRQTMGETFLDWAEDFFSDDVNLNAEIPKKELYDYGEKSFLGKHPTQRRFNSPTMFKKKVKAFAAYKGYVFNPNKPLKKNGEVISPNGGDNKTCGIEYIELGTK